MPSSQSARRIILAAAVLGYIVWYLRLTDQRFWSFIWAKVIFESPMSGYPVGELDHWPEAELYDNPASLAARRAKAAA